MSNIQTADTAVLGSVSTSVGVFGVAFSPLGLGRMTYPIETISLCRDWLQRWLPDTPAIHESPRLDELAAQLNAYFDGTLRTFSIPLDLRGTPFQREVWRTLQTIGYGHVWTYTQLANVIGRPQAARAVGSANALNPIPILVPCHRLVGSSGTLTGYAGGVSLKQRLLQLEGALDQSVQHSADARRRYRFQRVGEQV